MKSLSLVPIPRLYLGTMTFGWSQTSSRVDESVAFEMLQQFVAHNERNASSGEDVSGGGGTCSDPPSLHHRVDTARIYAGGKTEPIVGTVLAKLQPETKKVLVGSKAHPSQPGGLSPEGIRGQVKASLEAMSISSMHEFYLHQPDPEHPLRESLECLNGLVQDDKTIAAIGMSNYHASEMRRAFDLCRERNLTKPSVYQGLYNPLNRAIEDELLPCLREHDCSFVAYNPLAAGLLTGKHTASSAKEEEVQKGRFKNNQNYMPRFYTDANLHAVQLIRAACRDAGISMVEATYRWLLLHSALDASRGDGLLLGASSVAQLKENLDACAVAVAAGAWRERGPLPDAVLRAFEDAWQHVKSAGEVFPYWRSYSSDMPNRESLDQGASYSAAKK